MSCLDWSAPGRTLDDRHDSFIEMQADKTPDAAVATPTGLACSVLVLTLDEARNLDDCLASLAGFDDVHVLDSGSTDATVAIAEARGARVSFNRFTSFGQQRNWGHDHAPLRHRWVLHLDADERMTPALREEIAAVIRADEQALQAGPAEVAGYFIAEQTLLHGQWLRHAGQYPRYQVRLVHRDRMRFIDHGHGQREQGELPFRHLRQPYVHLAFSHGMEHWLRKHAGYATREAAAADAGEAGIARLLGQLWQARRSGGPARRRVLKQLAERLPARPFLRWFYVLFVCRGVLDGAAGWRYAEMMRVFQQMIDLSLAERRAAAAPAAPAPVAQVTPVALPASKP
jgi:glycosyltransferase involved in cell wall biosynthesis